MADQMSYLPAKYVVQATDTAQPNERVLTAGSGITITDAGANSTITISASGGGGGATIGGTVTGGTANSVLYINSTGKLAQDYPNFTYAQSSGIFTAPVIYGTTEVLSSRIRLSTVSSIFGAVLYASDSPIGGTLTTDVNTFFFHPNNRQLGVGINTFISGERMRVKGATLSPTAPTSPSSSINYNQSTGYNTGGYSHTYKIYSYKTVDGVTAYSPTYISGGVTDDGRVLSSPAASSFSGFQNFSGSGYTDGTDTISYTLIPYTDYPAGRTMGSSQAVGIAESNSGNPFSVDFNWADVGASGYYLTRNISSIGTDEYQDVGNVTSYSDTNSGFGAGAPSDPSTVPDRYNVQIFMTPPGGETGFIVTLSDTYNGYTDNYYRLLGPGTTAFSDDNTGWLTPTPNLSNTTYLGPWLYAEGDYTIVGNGTITGRIDQTGGFHSDNLFGQFDGTYGTVVPIAKGGTNNTGFTPSELIFSNGSALLSASQLFYFEGYGVTQLQLFSSYATNKGLLIKGAASQSGNLLEFQNIASTPIAYVSSSGRGSFSQDAVLVGINPSNNQAGFVVNGNASGANGYANCYIYRGSTSQSSGTLNGTNGSNEWFSGPIESSQDFTFYNFNKGIQVVLGYGTNATRMTINTIDNASIGLVVNATASASVDIQQWQKNGAVVALVNSAGNLILGLAGTQTGTIKFNGTTSGTVTLVPAAAAGTWTMTLPTSGGTSGYVLSTNGSGVTSWVAQSGGSGITRNINSVSTNTTAAAAASTDYVYLCSSTMTLTLPTAVSNTNRYSIKNSGSATVTIATTSAQTIFTTAAVSTLTLAPGESYDLVSNSSNWFVL